jgi:micrococcal nuclease
LNAELIYNGLGVINTRFCSKSEFTKEDWSWNYGCGVTTTSTTSTSTTTTVNKTTTTTLSTNCHPSYPDVCIPPPPPDLDCKDIPYRNFRVRWDVPNPNPHKFDRDRDGIECERR